MAMLEMLENLAIITSLALVYRVVMARIKRNSIPVQALIGLMFGIFAIIGMATPFTMMPGVIYDGRSITLSLAGLFCGPVTTAVAALIAAACRIWLGGGGVIAGVGTIIEASAFGLLFYYLRRAGKLQVNTISLLGLGVLVHIAMLLFQLIIPGGLGWIIWQEIGVYVMVFFTAATLVIGYLFLDSENQLLDRRALIKSENTLRKAQRVAKVGSWLWRAKDNFIIGSEELFRILGQEKGEGCSISVVDFLGQIHPDDSESILSLSDPFLTGQPQPQGEFRYICTDGSIRMLWFETGETLQDEKGALSGVSGILQDITDRRTIENELRENEARYRSLIMNSPDAILVNHEDRIALINNKAVELFGARDASQLLGKSVFDFFHPDYHDLIKQRIRQLRETRQGIPLVQEQIVRLDGQVLDVDVISATFHFHGVNDIHVIVRDISERKEMEKNLRESRDLLARLADQVPGAVFQLHMRPDGSLFFPYISPGIGKMHGLTPEELSSSVMPAFQRIHPDDSEWTQREMLKSSRFLEELNVEFRIFVPGKDYRWFQCSAKPERTADGGTLWSGILTDITDRKLDEQKIAEQLEELHRWQSVMLGREKRSIELKGEVNALLNEMGRPPRYSYTGENPPADPPLQPGAPGEREAG